MHIIICLKLLDFCRDEFPMGLGRLTMIKIFFPASVVKSHVCLLEKRPDPSRGSTMRWSLPYDEICYCKSVVSPKFISLETCPRKYDQTCSDIFSCNLWFMDDPTPLTQPQHWNEETLSRLLERSDYCG